MRGNIAIALLMSGIRLCSLSEVLSKQRSKRSTKNPDDYDKRVNIGFVHYNTEQKSPTFSSESTVQHNCLQQEG